MQDILYETVQGNAYYSDLFSGYQTVLYWPAIHYPMPDKSETYSVEGDNAELRHYLARLARKSRCFSRCEKALRECLKTSQNSDSRANLRDDQIQASLPD